MYPGSIAACAPERPAVVVAESGASVTYAELDDRSARLATALAARGLRFADTVLVVLENDLRWAEIAWACWRSGLYLGAANRHLTAPELAPLLQDARPRAIVTSAALAPTVRAAAAGLPGDVVWLVVGSGAADDHDAVLAATARDPHLVETAGGRLLFSSGTTGRPKPFRVHPQRVHPDRVPVRSAGLMAALGFDDGGFDDGGNVLLVPGPAYHAGPLGFLQSVHQLGGTVVLMERFAPEAALAAIERYRVTHSQWVPTMFVRLLALPEPVRARYDLSSHRVAVHAGAACPPEVKQAVLDWWGPIVHEYYGASEGHGRTTIGPQEWLEHRGSVGRPVDGTVHIADDTGRFLPPGEIGEVWFAAPGAAPPARADDGAADLAATPGWGTAGDLGRLDDDGYLHLAGRVGHTIITGGVNVYPREIEDALVAHPAVDDVAVLGVPDHEYGERVLAVVVPAPDRVAGEDLAAELIDHCRGRLAPFKCPRAVDFVDALPRSDAGKVLIGALRDRYQPTVDA